MGWKSLQERIHQIPLVLAGPMVRCTQPDAVTVWIALKESHNVTLKIFDLDGNILFAGSRRTIQVGQNLHIVAVTAKNNVKILEYGKQYLYDLGFDDGRSLRTPGILTSEGSVEDIVYPEYQLPSFPIVPKALQELRLVHGSCRKPHGESIDALASLDKMIGEALARDPKKRPHQLFLTGDQIYADDVADVLLFMLMDAEKALLGWSEKLPDVENLQQLNPGQRNSIATHIAGLTASIGKVGTISNLAKSHLFTLGEFCTMYLFAWSDVLWVEPQNFPNFEDVYSNLDSSIQGISEGSKSTFQQEVRYIKKFWATLKQVRRALANIPTYTIFDDHEITDDWYLNVAWCNRILNKPLGRRILQNGMLSYALCQGWGNTPEQFTEGKAGWGLLQATELWSRSAGTDGKQEANISKLIGLPNFAEITQTYPPRLPRDPEALTWHYIVTGPKYEVLVLDTRTQREFPGKNNFDFPGLLHVDAYDEQISNVPRDPDIEVTLAISAGPVVGVPFMENLQKVAKNISEKFGSAAWGFDTEAWGLEESAFERILSRMALRGLPNKQNKVVILSGDVHYSFSARLQYRATKPFEATTNINIELTIAQFTSSSLKNEKKGIGGSHSLHKKGFVPFRLLMNSAGAGVLGWENPQKEELSLGVCYTAINEAMQPIPLVSSCNNPAKLDLLKKRGGLKKLEIIKKPQWWYRTDFIDAKQENIQQDFLYINSNSQYSNSQYSNPQYSDTKDSISIPTPLPGQNRQPFLQQYLALATNEHHHEFGKNYGKEIVGLNNIAEVNFESVDGKDIVVQTLWWRLESKEKGELLPPFPLTRSEVSLDFKDRDYPMDDLLRELM
ncbi:hypothetical protein [Mastigocoleus sp. MO_188.B34]|uniref:hypothetical protein n=1 Tax=Mastigocoleus sp. MO_188.B34 TaxID=3036635 RepID=UPI0026255E22|nr:hypothetical protein [Mastigocoleus sp. MO_188.B34]MDJ0695669.1 hypothetical protein [Mastigocoleus sp. MO_188.B34]